MATCGVITAPALSPSLSLIHVEGLPAQRHSLGSVSHAFNNLTPGHGGSRIEFRDMSATAGCQPWRLGGRRSLIVSSTGLRVSAKLAQPPASEFSCSIERWRGRRGRTVLATGQGSQIVPAPMTADELVRRSDEFFRDDSRPIILFDGVCNLCNGGVNFMLANDSAGKARFAALQSEAGRALLARSNRSPEDISSIVLVEKHQSYVKSDAILRIGQLLALPLQALATLAFIAPLPLRDTVYDLVADNRYNVLGTSNECRLSDDRLAERFVQ